MAGLWSVLRHRRKTGGSKLPDPPILYLHLFFDDGLARHYIYDPGFLGKYEKLYPQRQT